MRRRRRGSGAHRGGGAGVLVRARFGARQHVRRVHVRVPQPRRPGDARRERDRRHLRADAARARRRRFVAWYSWRRRDRQRDRRRRRDRRPRRRDRAAAGRLAGRGPRTRGHAGRAGVRVAARAQRDAGAARPRARRPRRWPAARSRSTARFAGPTARCCGISTSARSHDRLGAPSVMVLRTVLHGALLEAVGPAALRLGNPVTSVAPDADGARGHAGERRAAARAPGRRRRRRRVRRAQDAAPRRAGAALERPARLARSRARDARPRRRGLLRPRLRSRDLARGIDAVYWFISARADHPGEHPTATGDPRARLAPFFDQLHEPFRAMVARADANDLRLDRADGARAARALGNGAGDAARRRRAPDAAARRAGSRAGARGRGRARRRARRRGRSGGGPARLRARAHPAHAPRSRASRAATRASPSRTVL